MLAITAFPLVRGDLVEHPSHDTVPQSRASHAEPEVVSFWRAGKREPLIWCYAVACACACSLSATAAAAQQSFMPQRSLQSSCACFDCNHYCRGCILKHRVSVTRCHLRGDRWVIAFTFGDRGNRSVPLLVFCCRRYGSFAHAYA